MIELVCCALARTPGAICPRAADLIESSQRGFSLARPDRIQHVFQRVMIIMGVLSHRGGGAGLRESSTVCVCARIGVRVSMCVCGGCSEWAREPNTHTSNIRSALNKSIERRGQYGRGRFFPLLHISVVVTELLQETKFLWQLCGFFFLCFGQFHSTFSREQDSSSFIFGMASG